MKTITADNLVPSYDQRHKPCAEMGLDETFIIETHDRIPVIASSDTLADSFEDPFDPIYSVTGPVFIKGTYPGNVLRIDILDITLHDKGIICATPGRAGFGDKIEESHSKIVDIRDSEI